MLNISNYKQFMRRRELSAFRVGKYDRNDANADNFSLTIKIMKSYPREAKTERKCEYLCVVYDLSHNSVLIWNTFIVHELGVPGKINTTKTQNLSRKINIIEKIKLLRKTRKKSIFIASNLDSIFHLKTFSWSTHNNFHPRSNCTMCSSRLSGLWLGILKAGKRQKSSSKLTHFKVESEVGCGSI